MKRILFFLLLTFVLSLKPKCKENEVYYNASKKCEKICEENEYFHKK